MKTKLNAEISSNKQWQHQTKPTTPFYNIYSLKERRGFGVFSFVSSLRKMLDP